MGGIPKVEELLREMGIKFDPTTPECRDLAQRLHDALAEVERLHQADCAPSFHLLQRAEAAEAEVARLRTFFAYSEESIWKQRAEAAEYNFGLEHDALVVAEAEVKKLRDDASVWSSNYQDVAAKLRDTYCARCHERMYP